MCGDLCAFGGRDESREIERRGKGVGDGWRQKIVCYKKGRGFGTEKFESERRRKGECGERERE